MSRDETRGKAVVVVGAGGNIGSHLVAHLARTPDIGRVVLIDRDVYDETNLGSQDIVRRDVGRPKATVQARRLREIAPGLVVEALAASVEDVPLGRLRGDVLLACVDSRATRCAINARAWRLGVPWIDAGVQGDELLARINVYAPGPGQPCHECSYDDRDYATLEQAYPCLGHELPAPTNAPSALGALAAAMQALECRNVLAGAWEQVIVGRQVTMSARAHRTLVTTFRENPRCRFDHEVWSIARVARAVEECTLEEALAIGRRAIASDGAVGLKLVDHIFAAKLCCVACGVSRELMPYPVRRLGPSGRICDACGGAMRTAGIDLCDWLRGPELSPVVRHASLASLGLRPGDVFSVSDRQRVAHFQIGGNP